jgi:hypothetical protein
MGSSAFSVKKAPLKSFRDDKETRYLWNIKLLQKLRNVLSRKMRMNQQINVTKRPIKMLPLVNKLEFGGR